MKFYILHESEPMKFGVRSGDLPSPWRTWQVGRVCFQIGG